MYKLVSLPLYEQCISGCSGWAGLRKELQQLGCDGVEAIWSGTEIPKGFPRGLAVGYHLAFQADWLDFFREDKTALIRKFGSLDAARSFYGGWGPAHLMQFYRDDLARAKALGVHYIVFHVTDVSIEETYTYQWEHTHREVIDTAADIINDLLAGETGTFEFLMENQWWPGFTMTDPEQTAYLLDAVHYPKKGIMLDTGHLLNTNPDLRSEREGVAYIHSVLDAHGDLCRYIRGFHFNQSLSGTYVRAHTGVLPALPQEYIQRFAVGYQHILHIDQHRPWTEPAVGSLVERVQPVYLTHELSAVSWAGRYRAVEGQMHILQGTLQRL